MKLNARIYTKQSENKTHYARLVSPKELRPFLSKSALWRSLGTKKKKDALVQLAAVSAASQLIFQEVADANVKDAPEVKVEVESKSNISAALEDMDAKLLNSVENSLRKSFGLKAKAAPVAGASSKAQNADT